MDSYKKSLSAKSRSGRRAAAQQARRWEMLLARAEGHNLQVYGDLYQAKNLDGYYLDRYAQAPKSRGIIRDLLRADGFVPQVLKSAHVAPRLRREFGRAALDNSKL